MGLRAAMAAIKRLEEALAINDPITVSSAEGNLRAYRIAPKRKEQVSAKVNFLNWPDSGSEQRMGTDREDKFTIQVDCLVDDADTDVAADIALAMFEAAWTAFDRERVAPNRLEKTVDYLNLRAERPMVEIIEWAGLGFPGFHIFLDLTIHEVEI